MSLYDFAAANLTTDHDRKRRPAVNNGQILRTLVLMVLFIVGLVVMSRQGHAAGDGFARIAAGISASAPSRAIGQRQAGFVDPPSQVSNARTATATTSSAHAGDSAGDRTGDQTADAGRPGGAWPYRPT